MSIRKIITCFAALWLTTAVSAQSFTQVNTVLLSEAFSADELANWVLESNVSIIELQEAAEVAVSRITPAASLDDPTFSYAFAPSTFDGGSTPANDRGLNQRIRISQTFPWPGTLKARRQAASADADASRENIAALRLDLKARAKAAYAEWYFIHRAIAIQEATYKRVSEFRSAAEASYAVGRGLQQDTLQAEVEQARLERQLLKLKKAKIALKVQINGLLNRAVTEPIPVPMSLPSVQNLPPLEQLYQQVEEKHPMLQRLRASEAARQAEVTLAEKAFYPDITLSAGYNGLRNDRDARTTFGFSVKLPLNLDKQKSALNGAKANARRVQAQQRNQYLQLVEQVAQTHAALDESLAAIKLYQASWLPLANEYVEAALADYGSGSGSFQTVVTAEQRKLATEQDYERNRADALRRLAELERWSGVSLSQALNTQNSNPQVTE